VADRNKGSALKSSIKEQGLTSYVHYLGRRKDIQRIIAGADIYVLTSRTEAFSMVVAEAMAAGKPVVATSCGGPEEMVVQKKPDTWCQLML